MPDVLVSIEADRQAAIARLDLLTDDELVGMPLIARCLGITMGALHSRIQRDSLGIQIVRHVDRPWARMWAPAGDVRRLLRLSPRTGQ